MSRPVIAPIARKHGIPDEDILHAYRNAIRRFELDDGLAMLIGATRAGELLERTDQPQDEEVGDHHAA